MPLPVLFTARVAESAVPSFSPLSISNCRLWLDGQDASSFTLDTSGGRTSVSQWSDKSGGARHFVQATKANQPTYEATSALNNKPALGFVSTNQYMLHAPTGTDLIQNLAGQTTFIVFRPNALPSVEGRLISICQNGTTVQTLQATTLRSSPAFRVGDKIRGSDIGAVIDAGTPAINTNYVICHAADAANGDLFSFVNGTALGSNTSWQTAGNFENASHGDVRLGGRLADRWFDGLIAEVVLYGRFLSPAERTSVTTALQSKWGIS